MFLHDCNNRIEAKKIDEERERDEKREIQRKKQKKRKGNWGGGDDRLQKILIKCLRLCLFLKNNNFFLKNARALDTERFNQRTNQIAAAIFTSLN